MRVFVVVAVLALGAAYVNGHAGITNPPCRTYVQGNPNSQCSLSLAPGSRQCGYLRSDNFPAGCPGPNCGLCTNLQTACIWTLATGCGEPAIGTMTTTTIQPGPMKITVTQNVAHPNPTSASTNFTALNSYTFYLSTNNHALNGNIFLGSFKQTNFNNQVQLDFDVIIPPMPYGETFLGFIQMQFKAYDANSPIGYKTYYSCSSVKMDAATNGQKYQTFGTLAGNIENTNTVVGNVNNVVNNVDSTSTKIEKTLNADNTGIMAKVNDIDSLIKATRGVAGGLGGAVLFVTTVTLIIVGSTCRSIMEGGRNAGSAL